MFEREGAPRADLRATKRLLKDTVHCFGEDNGTRLGAALAFYAIMSLAPLLIFAIAIAGMAFGEAAAKGQLAAQLQQQVGGKASGAIEAILSSAHSPSSGIVAIIIGFATLLFSASGVFTELQSSLNTIWGAQQKHEEGWMGMFRQRFSAFLMVFAVGVLLLALLASSTFLSTAGSYFARLLPTPAWLLEIVNFVVSFVVITVLFALLYKYVPNVNVTWSDVWIGAAFTSVLFTIGKLLIGLYLGKASVGSAYGAAGSLIALLAWLYYSALIFFFGAEFTSLFARRHGSLSQRGGERQEERRPDPAVHGREWRRA